MLVSWPFAGINFHKKPDWKCWLQCDPGSRILNSGTVLLLIYFHIYKPEEQKQWYETF